MKKSFTLLECLFALFILSLIVISLLPHLITLKSWKEQLNVQEEEFHEKKAIIHQIKNRAYSNNLDNLKIESDLDWSYKVETLEEGLEKIIISFPEEQGQDIYEVVIFQ